VSAAVQTEHPYVTRKPGVCGGSPIVAGRRIPVWQLAVLLREGLPAEEIEAEYAGRLSPAAVHDAISYYYDHQDEVEADIRRNTSDDFLQTRLAELHAARDERGAIRFDEVGRR